MTFKGMTTVVCYCTMTLPIQCMVNKVKVQTFQVWKAEHEEGGFDLANEYQLSQVWKLIPR